MAKRILWLFLAAVIVFFGVRLFLVTDEVDGIVDFQAYIEENDLYEDPYTLYLRTYEDFHDPYVAPISILAKSAILSDEDQYVHVEESFGYKDDAIRLDRDQAMTFEIEVEEESLYMVEVDYYYAHDELFSPKFSVMIDGTYPFYESRQTTLPISWMPEVDLETGPVQNRFLFDHDRYGDDMQPRSSIERTWMTESLREGSYIHHEPLEFHLSEGVHEITVKAHNDGTLFGELTFQAKEEIASYEDYSINHQNQTLAGNFELEAEYYTKKSDPSIKLFSDRTPGVTPIDFRTKRLNAIDAYTWDEAGRSVTWNFKVEETGLYHLSLKYIQYRMVNIAAYREIEIDGRVPFQELKAYAFPYSQAWNNITLGNEDGPFEIFLEEGEHELTMTATLEPYRPIIETIETIMGNITTLSTEVRRITGGLSDQYRDWDIVDSLPTISEDLDDWANELERAYRYGHGINGRNEPAGELVYLKYAYEKLRKLASNPNDIPNQMTELSEGTTSASQYLGDLMLRLTRQSIGLEKIYFHDQDSIPSARANIFIRISSGIRRFFLSFLGEEEFESDENKTIDVWVNRPRANIDLMQKMTDEYFTPESGITVNLSLMPNPTKLILAQAANIEPDLGMGVASAMPYEFAIRNAAVDLRQFEGYEDIVGHFAKGSMLPYVYEEGVYGFPESQDFFLTFYRTDIMSTIDAPIPSTWDEVIAILPALRRLGMNYYIPLSSRSSYKNFSFTAPFYIQTGAPFFSEDGLKSAIDSDKSVEAMRLMSGLYTAYDLPLQTPNFYNHFRYGLLPIGVGNSVNYLQLLIAAPEIKGNWEVALHPGFENEEGEIIRYAPAPTTGTMIFKSSEKQQMSFDYLSWWLSSETQIRFANDIQTMFGKEYMWFSSNLEALASLPLDQDHKDTILEQLAWAAEVPNVPGGYIVEREISNAWNKIVFNDENVRSAVDQAALAANRELWRKMAEFGYVVDNEKVRDFPYPTIDTIDDWLTERGDET